MRTTTTSRGDILAALGAAFLRTARAAPASGNPGTACPMPVPAAAPRLRFVARFICKSL